MSHTNSPEYFTITTVCQYDGSTNVLAICEDMDAVMYRLKRCYTTCGDEYRINCYHLSTAIDEAKEYNEQQVSRVKYKKESEVKDRLYEAFKNKDNESNTELATSQQKATETNS
tara:strand:+ start:586 stop:927 length:342 start_codon:yes stop_codon:yes gene_type:complete